MSKGLCEGYSACGRQQGAGRERLQMCEHPKAMRQPWAPMTWPTRGAGLWFGTVRWCPWSAALGLCACAREQSCMKSHKRFFSPRAVPAWLALTRVSVVGGHTHISKNKPTAGANSLWGRSKWEIVANSPFWFSASEVERTKWKWWIESNVEIPSFPVKSTTYWCDVEAISFTNEERIKYGPLPLEVLECKWCLLEWLPWHTSWTSSLSPSRNAHYGVRVCQSRHFSFMCHRQG